MRHSATRALLAAACLLPVPALAATYEAADTAALIEAMERAAASPGADTIRLGTGNAYLVRDQHSPGLALPRVTDRLTIEGMNSTLAWGGAAEAPTGLFLVTGTGSLEIAALTLQGATGGAITAGGKLTLRGSTLRRNTNGDDGAGGLTVTENGQAVVFRTLFDDNAGFKPAESGGAILNAGRLNVISTTFRDNTTQGRCGTFGAIPCFRPDFAPYFQAIYNTGRARVTNSTFKGNGVTNLGRLTMVNATALESALGNREGGRFFIANSAIFRGGCSNLNSLGHNMSGSAACKPGHPTDRIVSVLRTGLPTELESHDTLLVAPPGEQSELLDAADPARCPATDALANRRPVDGDHDGLDRCDIGAVELRTGDYLVDGRVAGLWYEPDRDGHYLLVERPDPGRLTVFWATYDGQGNPLWVFGTGEVEGNGFESDLTLQRGMRFGTFDPSELSVSAWGHIEIEFASCAELTMAWQVDGKPGLDGTARLNRLTQVASEECLP